ncbi:nitrate ABC transporter ATP-binding protein [Gloeobacter violaceus]|uniref:Nitrate/nitrite transport system ATP-binding protein n=1 Tax=Gloeobacter violaceus (strain ATCC 29082 / PCC 7421) TaxID=251221 RepID=Q7NKA9_GLOVI|nr:nitrate ABC transporter ATP-binding protein [Gloeobacter violaceus]BAC89510.1 nitrate/nitrite transport system ATP-binding protein [Gloeobacter violaceus PCC 7421]
MAFLEVQNAGKTFTARDGSPYEALKNVNLQIQQGEFVSIIGHSGCGKSTLLNLIAGLGLVTAGRVVVDGVAVSGPGPDRMVAFQNHSLLPWLTVRQNIALAVKAVHKQIDEAARGRIVEEHLEMVSLRAAADKKPGQISGGMRQRVGIARALATRPKVLLLDEPFGALDALTRGRLQEQLLKIWEAHRITVVMVTHDVEEALLLSDRIVMMSNGPAAKVAELMTVELPRPRTRMEVINNPHYYRQRNELLYFLNKAKKAAQGAPVRTPATTSSGGNLEKTALAVGFVPLSDCAPLVIAQEKGFFAHHGLEVSLSREPSWKAVLEGLVEERLDAAQIVAPMAFAGMLGGAGVPLVASLDLTRNGNAVTLHRRYWDQGVRDREGFARLVKSGGDGRRPVLGVVHATSMHNLLLRHWLAEVGIDPDKDVDLIVIPPPQMVANLQAGNIDGYCTGEPWNARAVHEGLGFVPATSLDLWSGHLEKVLGVRAAWAAAHPKTHLALVKALIEACRYAADPAHREEVIRLVCAKNYVNADPAYAAMGLSGNYDRGFGAPERLEGFNRFDGWSANPTERLWILTQLARWGLLTSLPVNWRTAIDRVWRDEPAREACAQLGIAAPPEPVYRPLTLPGGDTLEPDDPTAYIERFAIRKSARSLNAV